MESSDANISDFSLKERDLLATSYVRRQRDRAETSTERFPSSPYQRYNRYYQSSPTRAKRRLSDSLDNSSESHDELHFSMLRDGSPIKEPSSMQQSINQSSDKIPPSYDAVLFKSNLLTATEATPNVFQVVVRIRPMLKHGMLSNDDSAKVVDLGEDMKTLIVGKNLHKSNSEKFPSYQFTFDRVFDEFTNQHLIYQKCVAPMTRAVIRGVNCTVFAYGQTRSGKTYTLEGLDQDRRGLIPRSLEDIFSQVKSIKSESNNSIKIVVKASYIQLYNDVVSDLLTFNSHNLKVLEEKDKPSNVIGLKYKVLQEASDIFTILRAAKNNRNVASINKPPDLPARSHTILTIFVEQYKQVQDNVSSYDESRRSTKPSQYSVLRGKMNFVELAGSEKSRDLNQLFASSGSNLGISRAGDDGVRIAKTFNALATVVAFLSRSGKHVPYRDSKLTYILKDSLHSLALSLFVTTLYPLGENYHETLAASKYSSRIRQSAAFLSPRETRSGQIFNTTSEDIVQSKRPQSAGSSINRSRKDLDEKKPKKVVFNRSLFNEDRSSESDTDSVANVERNSWLQEKKDLETNIENLQRKLDFEKSEPKDTSFTESMRERELKMEIDDAKRHLDEAVTNRKNLENDVTHWRDQCSRIDHERNEYHSRLQDAMSVNSKLKNKLETSVQNIERLEKENFELNESKLNISSVNSSLVSSTKSTEHHDHSMHADMELLKNFSKLKDENSRMENQIRNLSAQLERKDLDQSPELTHDTSRLDIVDLENQVHDLSHRLEESQQETRSQKAKKNESEQKLRQRITELEGKTHHLNVQLEEARGFDGSHEAQRITELETQVKDLSYQLEERIDQSLNIVYQQDSDKQVIELEKQVRDLTDQLDQTRTKLNRSVEQLKIERKEELTMFQLQDQVRELTKKLEQSNRSHDTHELDRSYEISALESRVNILSQERDELKSNLEASLDQIVRITQERDDLTNQLLTNQGEDQVQQIFTEKSRVEKDLNKMRKQMHESYEENQLLRTDVANLKMMVQKLKSENENVEKQLQNVNNELEQKREEMNTTEDRNVSLQKTIKQFETSVSTQDQGRYIIEQLNGALSVMERELQDKTMQYKKSQYTVQNLEQMLRDANQVLDDERHKSQQDIQILRDEVAKYKQERDHEIEQLIDQHQLQLRDLHDRSVIELKKVGEASSKDSAAHKREISHLNEKYREEIARIGSLIEQQQKEMQLLREQHSREVQKIRGEYNRDLNLSVEESSIELDGVKDDHQSEIARLRMKHEQVMSEEMNRLRLEHQHEMNQLRSEYEQEKVNEINTVRQEHSTEIQRIRTELQSEVERLKREKTTENERMKSECSSQIETMTFVLNESRQDKEAVLAQLSQVRTTLVQLRQLNNDSAQSLQMMLSLSDAYSPSSPIQTVTTPQSPTMNQSYSGSVIADIIDQVYHSSQTIHTRSKTLVRHMEEYNEQIGNVQRERERIT
jgi:chromosome segregation ATPase